jgi:hypothetical protein
LPSRQRIRRGARRKRRPRRSCQSKRTWRRLPSAYWPAGLLFLGLFAVYFFDFFGSIGLRLGELGLGFFHLLTGAWLMYLAYATAVDFAIGYHWRV